MIHGLLYVQVVVNDVDVWVMIDFGVINNFVAKREDIHKESTRTIKIFNATQQWVRGSVMVNLKMRVLEGQCRMTIILLDHFDMILGIRFLVMAKEAPMYNIG